MLTSFQVTLAPPKVPGARLDVYVVPGWGFYTFLLATMLSLIITHVILAFHRASVQPPEWKEARLKLLESNLYV